MSEFLMIVPEGWVEIDHDIESLLSDAGGEAAFIDAAGQGMAAVDSLIEPVYGIEPGMTTGDFRLFKDGGAYRLWVKFVQA
jgi:hypothetical protein